MALKDETREIDGFKVRTVQFPAMRSLRTLKRVGEVLGPALAKAQGVDLEADVSALGPAIGALFENIGDPEALAREILESTTVIQDNRQIPLNTTAMIDLVFSGATMSLLKVMAFALEVNFGDFFAAAAAQKEALAAKQAAAKSAASA
jgi:hypothetical protein